jgi:transposase
VSVLPANIQDRDGARGLLQSARRRFPFIAKIFADAGYQGPKMARTITETGCWKIEIVKRSDAKGFVVLPKRWIVNPRTISPTLPISNGRRASSGRLEGAVFAGWRPTSAMERVDLSQAVSNR